MKVKFIKSPVFLGLGYHVGEEGEFDEKQAQTLIEKGIAAPAEEAAKPKKGKTEAPAEEAAKD